MKISKLKRSVENLYIFYYLLSQNIKQIKLANALLKKNDKKFSQLMLGKLKKKGTYKRVIKIFSIKIYYFKGKKNL